MGSRRVDRAEGLVREVQDEKHFWRPRWEQAGDDVGILKPPTFMLEPSEVEALIDKARERSALIVDLRGNTGGVSETLKHLLGGMFEKDVKIGDRRERKGSRPQVAVSRNRGVFTGKLVVLVGSGGPRQP